MLSRRTEIPSRFRMRHNDEYPSASEFQCGSNTTALHPCAGNHRAFAKLFSGYGVPTGDVKRKNSAYLPKLILKNRIRNFTGAEDLNFTPFQTEVCRRPVAKEFIARSYCSPVVLAKVLLALCVGLCRQESVAARPLLRPFDSPLKRSHDAIVIHGCEPGFPVVHPAGVE